MSVRCAIKGCGNDAESTKDLEGKVYYFGFPKNHIYALQWRQALGEALEFKSTPLFVCSKHFDQSNLIQDYESGEVKLSKGAIPNIKNKNDDVGRYVLVKMKDGDTRLVPGGAVVRSGKTITLKATARKSTGGGYNDPYLSKLKPILPKPDILPSKEKIFMPIQKRILIADKSLEVPKEQIIQELVTENDSSSDLEITSSPVKEDSIEIIEHLPNDNSESITNIEAQDPTLSEVELQDPTTSKVQLQKPSTSKSEPLDAEETETADSISPPISPKTNSLKKDLSSKLDSIIKKQLSQNSESVASTNLNPVVLLEKLNLPPDKISLNVKEYQKMQSDNERKRKSRKSPVRTLLCCVLGCPTSFGSQQNIKLYDLPQELPRRRKWLLRLGLTDSDLPNLLICSKHFLDSDFTDSEKSKFKPNAIPSIKLTPQVKTKGKGTHRKILLESSDDESPIGPKQPIKTRKIEIIAEVQDNEDGNSKKSYRVSVKKIAKKDSNGNEPKRSVLMDCRGSVEIVKQIVQSLDITKMKEINYKPGGSDESEVVLHGVAGQEDTRSDLDELQHENERLKVRVKSQNCTIAGLVQSKRRLQKKLADLCEKYKKLRSEQASTSNADFEEMETDNNTNCIVLGDSD